MYKRQEESGELRIGLARLDGDSVIVDDERLEADAFVFAGFAPSKSNDRRTWLSELANERRTVVFFEAPHRIARTLADMAEILADRPITVARELTKLHEQVVRSPARNLPKLTIPPKGEFALVLGPVSDIDDNIQTVDDKELASYFYQLTDSAQTPRRAAAETAAKFGLSTNDVYARLARLKAATPS